MSIWESEAAVVLFLDLIGRPLPPLCGLTIDRWIGFIGGRMERTTPESLPNPHRVVRVQAPLVDSVSCYCRVDASLKTVVGARKFVPGAKRCLQPEVVPIGPRPRNSRRERTKNHAPLLPGLPDDLAIACLIRVPRAEHQNLRLVCKRWNKLLSQNYFYSLRKKLGMAEEWVYVIKRDREGKISWHAFDPIHQLWKPLPPVPADYSEARGFGCAVLSGCYLYLFGGNDPSRGSMRRVIFFNARTNKWHRAPDMLRKRQSFGSCVINNCLYVAGGECEGNQRSLRSAEVYDPNKNKWSFVAEMSPGMVPYIGVLHEDKWFLKGLDSHGHIVHEVYIPATNSWSTVSGGIITNYKPNILLDGRLYASDCRDGCKLRVYEGATDSWVKFLDTKHHLGSSRTYEAASFVSLNGKLGIIRNDMSIVIIDVINPEKSIERTSARVWETGAGRVQLKNFVANLWSSIAGRNGLKDHILHCQVLQA